MSLGGLGALEKDIVIGVGASLYLAFGPHPKRPFPNGEEQSDDDVLRTLKTRATDDFLVFGVNRSADARLYDTVESQFKHGCRGSL
jgi:hypothetical protein